MHFSLSAAPKQMHLSVIKSLKDTTKLPVGLSDHSLGLTASITAVGVGASVFEKHITLDRSSKGPDHFYSLEPRELNEYVIRKF